MPICPHPSCPYENEEQPASEFDGFKWCKTCRQRAQKQKKSPHGRSNSNAGKVAKTGELKIGDPPQFAGEWDKKMYYKWLLELIKGVER